LPTETVKEYLMKKSANTIFDAIGNTPLVQLKTLNTNNDVKVYAKLEGNNPGGSIKDRPAYYMIKKAEESGELTPDKIIIEPTSGNTGIAIALIGAVKGYKVKLFMPDSVSMERQLILKAYGAELVLTPGKEATDGAIRRAHQLIDKEPAKYFMPNQFDNPNNPLAHYETTGPEIYKQTGGKVDAFIAAMGTSGTLLGTGKYLREKIRGIQIVGVEPTIGNKLQGLKNMKESIVPKIYDEKQMDDKITVEDEDAFNQTRMLVAKEGLFCGMSSGAAIAGAIKLAAKMKKGTIVTILADRGDRYLSTHLFRTA
jgi:S-sulfo-L-cysteine synthase (O-acetyl-L-serine-dependent)